MDGRLWGVRLGMVGWLAGSEVVLRDKEGGDKAGGGNGLLSFFLSPRGVAGQLKCFHWRSC